MLYALTPVSKLKVCTFLSVRLGWLFVGFVPDKIKYIADRYRKRELFQLSFPLPTFRHSRKMNRRPAMAALATR